MSWIIDSSHAEINFSVRHMMITNVRGQFEKFEGVVDFNEENPVLSTVKVQIEAASINTREAKRDGHLRSPDFLNAEHFPYLYFTSKRIDLQDPNHATVYGDLTIRDITKEVALEVTYHGKSKAPWGVVSAGFSANTRINRKDWQLVWNMALETGGMLVGDEVTISIELELIQQPESAAA